MNTQPLLDPALRSAVEQYAGVSPVSAAALADIRVAVAAQLSALGAVADPAAAEGVCIEDRIVPGPAGNAALRLRLYRPADEVDTLRPAVLHLHGGGFVLGTPEISEQAAIHQVLSLGCVVVSVDYRLAPEHPYPAAMEDAYAGLLWLHENSAGLGVDVTRLAVAGESAGGGLAAGLALLARDRGGPALCLQLLDSPMLDDRTVLRVAPPAATGQFIWTRENSVFAWGAYLGSRAGGDEVPSYAAAARAVDLTDLPPAFISVGALDLFVIENIEYARRLLADGVQVELHVHSGTCHGYALAPQARATQAYRRDSIVALRRAFFGD